MNWDGQDRMQRAIEPEMHRKILLRAAELVAMGWTTGAGARNEGDERVHGTNPTAVSWCLTGAVFRALFEIVGLDGYEGREASIIHSVNFWWVLMQPLHRALARRGCRAQVVEWNDRWCREPAEAEAVLREAAACLDEPRP
jgi:hypothetical protein